MEWTSPCLVIFRPENSESTSPWLELASIWKLQLGGSATSISPFFKSTSIGWVGATAVRSWTVPLLSEILTLCLKSSSVMSFCRVESSNGPAMPFASSEPSSIVRRPGSLCRMKLVRDELYRSVWLTLRNLTAPVKSPFTVTVPARSEEHTSELQSRSDLVCRLLLEKKKVSKAQAS